MILCLNGYLLLVVICLNYNYELLGVRAGHIGHQPSKENDKQFEAYEQMIELIKLHMQMNR